MINGLQNNKMPFQSIALEREAMIEKTTKKAKAILSIFMQQG